MAGFVEPKFLSPFDLHNLGVVHDDLHHAEAQRPDLLPHNRQPNALFLDQLGAVFHLKFMSVSRFVFSV
jgi:hypothetical protein